MKLIRLRDVMECTGLARSTIYKYIAEGTFPKSVSLGSRVAAWVESEIEEWILERIAERDESDPSNASTC
ncbi:helix-turn-helix transcriptional regulator [Shewanella sp.]|uniref:helix-turn-helix transcriptional regulator n=1 Tax=Shewanella sp. TaxID=50422 RepID=UPI003A96F757